MSDGAPHNDPVPRWIIWQGLDTWLGVETSLCRPRHGFHLFCIQCGSRIPWRALTRRWWHHTACPSCDDYITYMRSPAAQRGEPAFPEHIA